MPPSPLLKRSFFILISVSLIATFPQLAHSAEVFYLNSSAGSFSQETSNSSYSLSKRFKDLLDFSTPKDNKERSGRLSGSLSQEVSWQKVSGNSSKSFLRNGTDYNTELNLNMQEKLWSNHNMEGQWFIRKTDNNRIEPRRDVRLKQANVKILNPQNLYQFGDFYGDLSTFTLGSSLEGFNIDLSPSSNQKYHMIVARENEADVAANKFQRNIFGFKADHYFFENSELFSNVRMGLQAVSTQDDSATMDRNSSTKDVRNTVIGIDGEWALRKILSMNFELARSMYLDDEDSTTIKDQSYGTAFRFQPTMNFGKLMTRYLYYYVDPKFYTQAGSASPDKMQHQFTFDYKFSDKVMLNLVENLYWDHLDNSARTMRTTNDEKYVTLNIRPFDTRRDFMFRPYINYLERNSDDAGNTVESTTRTAGFSVSDTWNTKTTYGFNYEHRAFTDEANKATSDYFNRLGFNLGREGQLFERRLYVSLGPNFDVRRSKRDNNQDVNISTTISGQYDIHSKCVMRFGHNLQDTNSAIAAGDFVNNKAYGELDFIINQRNSAHLILRGERNHYDHESGTQDYDETRAITKFLMNF